MIYLFIYLRFFSINLSDVNYYIVFYYYVMYYITSLCYRFFNIEVVKLIYQIDLMKFKKNIIIRFKKILYHLGNIRHI